MILSIEVSGFSVQVSAFEFLFLTPETRNLTPKSPELGVWDLIDSTTSLLWCTPAWEQDHCFL
jgi:hypothetical protein